MEFKMWLEASIPQLISKSKYMGTHNVVVGLNGKRYDFRLPASAALEKAFTQFRYAPWKAFNMLKALNAAEQAPIAQEPIIQKPVQKTLF